MRGQAVLHTMLEARETEDIPLVKLTPIVLDMGHYELTNRVKASFTLVGNCLDLRGLA
jgi:hypothetical protein